MNIILLALELFILYFSRIFCVTHTFNGVIDDFVECVKLWSAIECDKNCMRSSSIRTCRCIVEWCVYVSIERYVMLDAYTFELEEKPFNASDFSRGVFKRLWSFVTTFRHSNKIYNVKIVNVCICTQRVFFRLISFCLWIVVLFILCTRRIQ